ncbi:HD domain-containing protein [Sphingobium nicotianae]|uniref:HD domain-containing protein n=1 Tax=Sphingobium nicotianae TaxID=2782607 RepID=A0A9X1IQW9_9SPHN|nr:HD domain-containing protein [Sphingobium nicotianae]MBT2186914.1 HD domain-containing protein [Sphingobium nicotianae]
MASLSERADALEHDMAVELERKVAQIQPIRSAIYVSGEYDPASPRHDLFDALAAGKRFLMGPDPRIPAMPEKPTLQDFFRMRFGNTQHVLQSAKLARDAGHDEKVVLACLLHDISVTGFINGDHGYWGAALVEPYVDEEVSWAIRAHQILRFFPDESVGYTYPEAYIKYFGPDFTPEPYVHEAYKLFKDHKYYMTGRLICLNDYYAFDPSVRVELEEFEDIIARNFRQPEEGLGFDHSPSAHMWRTISMPTRAL